MKLLIEQKKQKSLLIILAIFAFFQSLDTSITNLSLSYIGGDLATSPIITNWINTVYLIGYTVAVLTSGWLSARVGQVKLTKYAIFLFLINSLFCAVSMHILQLVVARFFLGLTAGLCLPLVISLLIKVTPDSKRAIISSSFFTLSLLAPFIAPFVGAVFSQLYSWRGMFLINVPICIVALLAMNSILEGCETIIEKQNLDKSGLFFLLGTVTFIKILVDKGSQYDWFKNPLCIALLIAGVVCLVYLIFREHTTDNPIIDFSYFKNPQFFIGSTLTIIGYIVLYGVIVLIPHLLFNHMQFMPLNAGLCLVPIGICPILLFFPTERLLEQKHVTGLMYIFGITMAVCVYILSLLTSAISSTWIQAIYLLTGLPLSLFLAPLFTFTTQGISKERSTAAVGLFLFLRTFAAGLSGSLILYLWDRRQIFHYFRIVETIQNQHQKLIYNPAVFEHNIKLQSTILATNDLFRLFVYLMIVYLVLLLTYQLWTRQKIFSSSRL